MSLLNTGMTVWNMQKNLKGKPFKRDIDESNVQPVVIAFYASGTEGETEV